MQESSKTQHDHKDHDQRLHEKIGKTSAEPLFKLFSLFHSSWRQCFHISEWAIWALNSFLMCRNAFLSKALNTSAILQRGVCVSPSRSGAPPFTRSRVTLNDSLGESAGLNNLAIHRDISASAFNEEWRTFSVWFCTLAHEVEQKKTGHRLRDTASWAPLAGPPI